jgi:hypothetical protein
MKKHRAERTSHDKAFPNPTFTVNKSIVTAKVYVAGKSQEGEDINICAVFATSRGRPMDATANARLIAKLLNDHFSRL